tara:strand:- start:321 stop:503 length:183 start_codon:yes stop_codon:yes gene_type:complete
MLRHSIKNFPKKNISLRNDKNFLYSISMVIDFREIKLRKKVLLSANRMTDKKDEHTTYKF